MKRLPNVQVRPSYTKFEGGLDVTTPPLNMVPGSCRNANNVYQDINGGYKTFQGYEAFNGKPSPADAQYATLDCVLTGSVVIGNVVTDDAGTTYGTVIAIAPGYLVLTKVTGLFSSGNIKVGALVVGTCTGPQSIDGAITSLLHAQYKNLAADCYAADISEVPGSGEIRGVWYYNGFWYAFRDNDLGTATVMHKNSATGWVEVPLGKELSFTSGGTYEILPGDTITGAISTKTAIVLFVALESGTFAAGTASGKIIYETQSGDFQAETLNVGSNIDVATISGNGSDIAFSVPGGKFEFINANFTGSADTAYMYGVDGKNRGFEFDGSIFVPISTGMTVDTPEHIYEHKYHLFFSFHGLVQHSAPGYPYQWSIIADGDEIGMGDRITGFLSMPGSETSGTLAIFTRNSIGMLYGNNVADWNLAQYKKEAGAIEWSSQLIGNAFMLDDRGIIKLKTSQVYGNFSDATVSKRIQTWLNDKKSQLTASCIVRELNQYWLFFADKTAICCTVDDGEIVASLPMIFNHKITCICSAEDTNGKEIIMFGSDDGFIYQMYRGTSFAGGVIGWNFDLAFDNFKTPMVDKKFKRAMLEAEGDGYAEFFFSYTLQYGDGSRQQPTPSHEQLDLSAVRLDSGYLDSGYLDGVSLTPSYFKMHGTGTNVSLTLQGSDDYSGALRFSGSIILYSYTKQY